MRNVFIILIVIIISSGFTSAQVGFGPELGVGMSTFKFAPMTSPIDYTSASVSPIFSGKIGGIVDMPLSTHIYFQAGLSLSLKGGNKKFSYYRSDSFNESVDQTLYIDYLELPLSVVFKTGTQGMGRFTLGIGATPSYIIGGKNKLQDQGFFNDTSIYSNGTYKIGTTAHAFDIGVSIAAGYELPTGLFFKLYYTAGVNDIGEGTEVDKNRMYGIAAGYIFGKERNINKEADDLIDKGE
jgi:outer membrane protein with beta-barrel domain